jgi:hypothetical protein
MRWQRILLRHANAWRLGGKRVWLSNYREIGSNPEVGGSEVDSFNNRVDSRVTRNGYSFNSRDKMYIIWVRITYFLLYHV